MSARAPEPGENIGTMSRSVGLPMKPFLYTLDQVSALLEVEIDALYKHYIYYQGRSTGGVRKDLLIAHNIAPHDLKPDWRVGEKELVRWLRRKGFRYYDRASIRG
jgi:hypothetical protein